MLTQETKRKIDSARQILVGKVPDPKAQVEQITTALIYKFMDDMDKEAQELGGKARFFTNGYEKYAWTKVMDSRIGGQDRLNLYVEAITTLSQNPHLPQLFRDIFKDAFLPYRDPETLNLFLKEINGFNYDHSEDLGDAFEYLLSILGSQGDAGQFRTPRHIIDFIVAAVDPKKDETICDPACGTAGFLISAFKHILKENKEKSLTPDERKNLMDHFVGYDISPDMVRLSKVNLYLHGFPNPTIFEYDTLSSEEKWDENFDVMLANPPFMSPKGGIRPHKRFSVQANRSEVLFVDYILEHLRPNGRAGIIVPEGIIFQSATAYKALRKLLIEDGLLVVVSLPAGVFNPYAGVKTSILLFDNGLAKKANLPAPRPTTYVIRCDNESFYIGQTENLLRRWEEHKRGLVDWTKKHKPLEVIHYEEFETIKEAIKREQDLKTGFGRKWLKREYKTGRLKKWDENAARQAGDILFLKISNDGYDLGAQRREIDKNDLPQALEIIKKYKTALKEGKNFKLDEKQSKIAHLVAKEKIAESGDYSLSGDRYKEAVNFTNQKWPIVELGEVAEIGTGNPAPQNKELFKNGKYHFFRTSDVGSVHLSDNLMDSRDKLNEVGAKGLKLFPKNTILFPKSGASTFLNHRAMLGAEGYVSSHLATIVPNENKILPKFLFNLLTKIDAKTLTNDQNYPSLKTSEIAKIKIPLPPLEVQKEIVEQIEVKQKAIEAAKAVIENLEKERRYFGQTLRLACRSLGAGREIKDVEWVELGELYEIERGGSPRPIQKYLTEKENGINWIKIGDTKNISKYISKTEEKIIPECAKKSRMVYEGDFILSNSMSFGRPYIMKTTGCIHDGWLLLRAKTKKVDQDFLYYTLASEYIYEQFEKAATGGVVKNLNIGLVKKVKIPLPPLEIQKQLVTEMEEQEKIIEANKKLIGIMEQKIAEVLNDI